ncbi:hypothetical protein AVEN_184825-1 [Araneus ventricosus]|uniref:Uncharacterized protein n=1 Tax=Araneus ventricosus TaxID=182803 RepID=A0A4Y2J3C4_ARAVE|nr:hypothetical protein AVEN_184824-1 [Araneus ventricosus]GBM84395.1 hypothetical protein AVEN_184825-1 [Araneus ventricosus]
MHSVTITTTALLNFMGISVILDSSGHRRHKHYLYSIDDALHITGHIYYYSRTQESEVIGAAFVRFREFRIIEIRKDTLDMQMQWEVLTPGIHEDLRGQHATRDI